MPGNKDIVIVQNIVRNTPQETVVEFHSPVIRRQAPAAIHRQLRRQLTTKSCSGLRPDITDQFNLEWEYQLSRTPSRRILPTVRYGLSLTKDNLQSRLGIELFIEANHTPLELLRLHRLHRPLPKKT